MFSRARSRCFSSNHIGFIGLGAMGGPMATNLLSNGKKLFVYDVCLENIDTIVSLGAVAVESPLDMIKKDCCTIITMLPSTPHVQQVYQGENGLLSGLRNDMLFIDSSTIEPSAAKTISEVVTAGDSHMVDAPVSGGINGAAAGTLTFMVGGSTVAFEKASPVLECMGKNIVHCGDASMGQVAKLCNNVALAIEMIGVSEALTLGVKCGMDAKILSSIMNTSTSQCWTTSNYNPFPGVMENVPSSKEYEGGFASMLMRKDLGLALSAAQKVEASVPLTAASYQLYNMIVNAGAGRKDFGVVLKFLQGKNLK